MTESRPRIQKKDTLKAANLSGTLSPDGIAALQPDHATPPISKGSAGVRDEDDGLLGLTDGSASAKPVAGKDDGEDEDEELMESYDDIRPDPDTLISTRRSVDIGRRPDSTDMSTEDVKSPRSGSAAANIQVRLERTDKQGRYILTADDPDLKEVLRKGIEREEAEAGRGKPRMRFRDLVFTRQCACTIFPLVDDMQNTHTSFSQSLLSIDDMLQRKIVLSSASSLCSGSPWYSSLYRLQ